MKIYYLSIRRYDGENEVFTMCAASPEEAVKNGRKFISQSTYYSPTVYNHGSLHIVKNRDEFKPAKLQLKNATWIIDQILHERDKIPLKIKKERYLPVQVDNQFGNAVRCGLRKSLRIIEQAPTIDAVLVVRCKNCIHCSNETLNVGGVVFCKWWSSFVREDGFCHIGKAKEGEK